MSIEIPSFGEDGIEKEISPEQKEILDSAVNFADYLTNKYPQIDDGTKRIIEIDEAGQILESPPINGAEPQQNINYCLSGSLATMLLSKADSFSEIKENRGNNLKEGEEKIIPEKTHHILSTFARPIGDVDFDQTDFYETKKSIIFKASGKIPAEKYRNLRSQYLYKGGSGPSFDEVPDNAQKCLNRGENQVKIMFDPVKTFEPKKIAKIKIKEKDYYITAPDNMLAYKVLHLLQSYHIKPEKFNDDFGKMLNAIKELYSEEDLEKNTVNILKASEKNSEDFHVRFNKDREDVIGYEKKIPGQIEKVLANPNLSKEVKSFIEKIKEKIVSN